MLKSNKKLIAITIMAAFLISVNACAMRATKPKKLIAAAVVAGLLVPLDMYVINNEFENPDQQAQPQTRPLYKEHPFFDSKAVDSFSQSPAVNFCTNWLGEHIPDRYPDAPLASKEIQQLGHQAQDDVGIPKERQAAIRVFSREAIFIASFKNIYLSSDQIAGYHNNFSHFDFTQYGAFNSALHHEAVHIKYNDPTTGYLVHAIDRYLHTLTYHLAVQSLIRFATHTPGRFAIKPHTIGGLIALLLAEAHRVFREQFHIHVERRADIEGTYATSCATCAYQGAQVRQQILSNSRREIEVLQKKLKNSNALSIDVTSGETYEDISSELKYLQQKFLKVESRYISPQEMDLIAAYLKEKNELCDHHRAEQQAALNQAHDSTS